MSNSAKNTLSDRQYEHLRIFLSIYAKEHDLTYTALSRWAQMGDGTLGAVMRNRKPTIILVKRISLALGVTMPDLLGPPEPAPVEPVSCPMEPMAREAGPLCRDAQELCGLMRDGLQVIQDCLRELQGIHRALTDVQQQDRWRNGLGV